MATRTRRNGSGDGPVKAASSGGNGSKVSSQGAVATRSTDAAARPEKNGTRPTLLLVDDNAGSLNLVALEVREWPDASRFQLELATSGRKAVEFIERSFVEQRPVFVLCDVRMAGLNGLDVLRAVAGRSTAPFRFVLTTAGDHPELREQAFALGVDDFLLKINQPGALWEALQGRLNRWLRACEAQATTP